MIRALINLWIRVKMKNERCLTDTLSSLLNQSYDLKNLRMEQGEDIYGIASVLSRLLHCELGRVQ